MPRQILTEKGAFRNSTFTAGDWTIAANKPGVGRSEPVQISIREGESLNDIRLVLHPGLSITGHVRDVAGKPIKDAMLLASPTARDGTAFMSNARTKDDGAYRMDDLTTGSYELTLTASGYNEPTARRVLAGSTGVDITLVSCQTTATVVGQVVDWKTSAPVHDFTVRSDNEKALKVATEESQPGMFKATWIKREEGYRDIYIRVEAPGYLPTEIAVDMRGRDAVRRTFVVGPGGAIRGRVIDAKTSSPMAGTKVTLETGSGTGMGPDRKTATRGDGAFEMTGVEPGKHTIRVIAAATDDVLLERPVVVSHGSIADVGSLRVGVSGVIHGRVVRMPGGSPAGGVQVTLSDLRDYSHGRMTEEECRRVTDKDGGFAFENLKPSQYDVKITDGFASREADLTNADECRLDLQIGAGRLRGSVTQAGRPVPQASVRITQDAGECPCGFEVKLSDDGVFDAAGLLPGRWYLSCTAPQTPNELREEFDITGGETIEKALQLPAGVVCGKVLDRAGKPVAGAYVRHASAGTHDSEEYDEYELRQLPSTDADGSFTLTGLKAGRHAINAWKPEVGTALTEGVQVSADGMAQGIVVKLDDPDNAGTIRSTVLSASTGKAIADARCAVYRDGARVYHAGMCDSAGLIKVSGLPAGKYRVVITAPGHTRAEHEVNLAAGTAAELTDVLSEAGDLVWTLLADGETFSLPPGEKVGFELVPTDSESVEQPKWAVLDDSEWKVSGVLPGVYKATARLTNGGFATCKVTISAGQVTEERTPVE